MKALDRGFVLVLAAVWMVVTGAFVALYMVAHNAVLGEIRSQAMSVAQTIAMALSPDDLDAIRGPDSVTSESFRRVQEFVSGISRFNADVRYVYTMRKSSRPDARATDFEYIVDQAAFDANSNGRIDPDEITELPGNRYDASRAPEMVNGWRYTTADRSPQPDPPYPDVLSGYAPIKRTNGVTMAMVGVDITARTVAAKLLVLRIVTASAWLLIGVLGSLIVLLYERQKAMVKEREGLIVDLRTAVTNARTLGGLLPICSSCKKIRNDGGYWEQIEQFVSANTEAEFSHSLCPECSKKLYPGVPTHTHA